MGLRNRMSKTADRLTEKYGDTVVFITVTSTPGATEFDPPTLTQTRTNISAVVTGADKWADGVAILQSDLSVLVGGGAAVYVEGGLVEIDGAQYVIVSVKKSLAAGVTSATRYIVRRG